MSQNLDNHIISKSNGSYQHQYKCTTAHDLFPQSHGLPPMLRAY